MTELGPITEAEKLREERDAAREELIEQARGALKCAEAHLMAACCDTDIEERAESARQAASYLDRACALGSFGISQGWGDTWEAS